MAVNDLMMKIQLLVDAGKSTAELRRLRDSLKQLNNDLKLLENTRINLLSNDLNDVQRAIAKLKTTNLTNFAKTLDEVSDTFKKSRIAIDTTSLDKLRTAYQNLSTAKASNEITKLTQKLNKAKEAYDFVRQSVAKGLLITGKTSSGLNVLFDVNQVKAQYREIQQFLSSFNDEIYNNRQRIIDLKTALRGVGAAYQKELREAGKLDIAGLNRQLLENKADLIGARQAVSDYRESIRTLRNDIRSVKDEYKQISAKNLISFGKADIRSDISRYSRGLTDANAALKEYKDNLKLIQDSSLKFRIASPEKYISDINSIALAMEKLKQSRFGSFGFDAIVNGLRSVQQGGGTFVRSIATIKREIASLKDEIKVASQVKFTDNVSASLLRLGSGIRAISYDKSFASLRDFNNELNNQQQSLLRTQNSIRFYQQALAQLRLEAQKTAIPDFTLGGTTNLVRQFNDTQKAVRDLRNEFLPLQNDLRVLQASKGLDKAKYIEPLKAANQLYAAQIGIEKLKAKELRDQSLIDNNVEKIAKNELKIAEANKRIVDQYGWRSAQLKEDIALQRNKLSGLENEEKTIRQLMTSERQRAREAAQLVKTRKFGIFDVTQARNEQQNLESINQRNIKSLKSYFTQLKQNAQESAASLVTRLTGLNTELSRSRELESIQKSLIANQQRAVDSNKILVASEEEKYKNMARAMQLENQLTQKRLAEQLKERQLNLTESQKAVESIKQKVSANKEELASLKSVIKLREDDVRSQIDQVRNAIASSQITKQQANDELKLIRDKVKEQRDLSRIYQEGLRQNIEASKLALKGEESRIRAIENEIKLYSKLNTESAKQRILGLQDDLLKANQSKSKIKEDIANTESLAKSELQRIKILQDEAKASEKAAAAAQKQGGSISFLGGAFKSLAGPASEFMAAFKFAVGPQMLGFAAGAKLVSFADSFVQINKQVENLVRGLNAISLGKGLSEFNTLVGIANRLGISINETTHSFLQLKASAMGTGLEGEKINKIFTSFANALNVTGADSVSFNRAFRALSQMIAKGQIYAEELKGQLAEQLPGSIQLFARALDLPTNKFMALVKSGALAGSAMERALVLAAKEADRSYKQMSESSFTFSQKAALAKNAFLELNVAIGNTGIWKAMGNSMLYVRDALVDIKSSIPAVTSEFERFKESVADLNIAKGLGLDSGGLKYAFTEVGGDIAEAIKFIYTSFRDLPINIQNIVEVCVNLFASLGAEVFKLANDIGLPVKESFERVGVYIKSFFQDVSNNVNLVASSLYLGFREYFYVPVLEFINDLKEKFSSLLTGMANGLSSLGFEDTSQKIKASADKIKSSMTDMGSVNQETNRLNDNLKKLQSTVVKGLSPILEENLANLAKQHKAVRDAIDLEYQSMKRAAEQGIQDSIDNRVAKLDKLKKTSEDRIELAKSEQREIQRIGFYEYYNNQLKNDGIGVTVRSLSIGKEELAVQKKKLDLEQAYQNTLLKINASKYKRWAEQGQISQSGADFLIQSAQASLMQKAWSEATNYVEEYNKVQKQIEKQGDNVTKGELEYLNLLRQRADDQLAYAEKKAEEVDNEERIKQIHELRKNLKDGELKTQLEINAILDKVEKKRSEPQQPVTLDTEGVKKNYIEMNGQLVELAKNNPVAQPVTINPADALTENDKLNKTLSLPVTKQVFIEWVNSNSASPSSGSGTGGEEGKRWGGFISGYGGGDRIRALLEPGEFVLRKEAVKALGINSLYHLNQLGARASMGLIDQVSIPHFASGGMVSGNPIVINIPGSKPIHLSGSRDAAMQLVNVLTRIGRAL